MRRAAAALLLVLLTAVAAPAAAAPRVSYNDVEDEVMCVQCNVPLNIAESDQADQEKRELRRIISTGATKKQVLAQMVGEYGPNVLAKPKDKGFNLLAWVVPIGVSLGLIALGVALLPRWRRARAAAGDGDDLAPPALEPDDARRLDEDMARLGA